MEEELKKKKKKIKVSAQLNLSLKKPSIGMLGLFINILMMKSKFKYHFMVYETRLSLPTATPQRQRNVGAVKTIITTAPTKKFNSQ